MLRRVTLVALFAIILSVFAQAASADPSNAKKSSPFIANCGGPNLMVVVNGNGEFTPAQVIGSTAVFIPTALPSARCSNGRLSLRNSATCSPSRRSLRV